MDTYEEALDEVLNKLNNNFKNSKREKLQSTNDFLNFLDLLEQVYNVIPNSLTKTVFDEIRSDLLSSLIFCYEGYYRHSNICLRSSLELTLSYLYYSDNQYDFILWKNDCIDMTWSKLVDSEKGVLNQRFLSIVFGEEVNIKTCAKKIQELYHLTSQYVHGKYDYMQQRLGDSLEYSNDLAERYFQISKNIIEIELVVIYLRFRKDLLNLLDPEESIKLDRLLRKYEVIK